MEKRGVSPLIATVLLIAFAVSIGAVIITYTSNLSKCGVIFFDISSKEGKPDICYDSKTVSIYVSIENSGKADLSGFKAGVYGKKDISNVQVNQSIRIGQAKKLIIPYDSVKYGEIEKMRLLPIMLDDDKTSICPVDKGVIISKIPSCG